MNQVAIEIYNPYFFDILKNKAFSINIKNSAYTNQNWSLGMNIHVINASGGILVFVNLFNKTSTRVWSKDQITNGYSSVLNLFIVNLVGLFINES